MEKFIASGIFDEFFYSRLHYTIFGNAFLVDDKGLRDESIKRGKKEAPWPAMRGNFQNSGILLKTDLARPMENETPVAHFRTGNAVFSTPIIDARERIYVGSGDHKFYAFDPHEGKEVWSKEYSEIIDSAACMDDNGILYVPGGDGQIHALSSDGKELWTFNVGENRPRERFTFSTLYWYEANIAFGPDGALYVANDDFFFYKMSREGKVVWAFRTGFLIWSAPAFSADGKVFIAGFDHTLYAIEMTSGKKIWAKKLGGSLVSSPVVGQDDTIYQGSFNGNLYAIDAHTGKIKWQFDTGSHIYATPAQGPDKTLYLGSTNGLFYALDGETGSLKWTYYIGEPIRSSAAIGMDIEGKAQYLIFFGGGDGVIYALDLKGQLRWAYNSLSRATNTDYPNINSSIALGYTGLAVGSSTGDILWIPYNYFLREETVGVVTQDLFHLKGPGPSWHWVSPGGKLDRDPISGPQDILPVNVISLRLLVRDEKGVVPGKLNRDAIEITTSSSIAFQVILQSDNCTINIVPEEILAPDAQYSISIRVIYSDRKGIAQHYSHTFQVKTSGANQGSCLLNEPAKQLKIVHMAMPQPAIIPSLNQIGFASLQIPFRILDQNKNKDQFVAWGVQKFGGEGAAASRVSYYAFAGRVIKDYFMMDARNCLFEITAFFLPIDQFRIAGQFSPDGSVKPNGSLVIYKHVGKSLTPLLGVMRKFSPLTMGNLWRYFRQAGFIHFFKALKKFLPALFRQMSFKVWQSWGLLNTAGDIAGIGTFRFAPYTSSKDGTGDSLSVQLFRYDAKNNQIFAEIQNTGTPNLINIAFSIVLIDLDAMKPVPLNYTSTLETHFSLDKIITRLKLPKTGLSPLTHHKAYLLGDLTPIADLIIK